MDIQYKPSKPKKEKPAKAPKAEKAMKFKSSVQTVKPTKPAKAPKAPKSEKAKAITFGKADKMEVNGPIKVEKAKKSGPLSKIDPKWILCGALVLIAAIAVVVMTVILPGIEENGQQIKNIIISSTPDKTVYLVGEEANYDGLRVLVTRNNGETFTVRAGKCQITGFDTSKEGYKTITVEYEGYTSSFSVKVEEPPRPTPVLQEIVFDKLPKTEYKVGDSLDTTGGVLLCKYADGSELYLDLVNGYVSGFSNVNGPGTYELTVKYKENGTTARTTYTITVTE